MFWPAPNLCFLVLGRGRWAEVKLIAAMCYKYPPLIAGLGWLGWAGLGWAGLGWAGWAGLEAS